MNNNSNQFGNSGNNQDIAQNSNPRNDVTGVFNDAERNRLNSGLILANENKNRMGSRLPEKSDNGLGPGNTSTGGVSGGNFGSSSSSSSSRNNVSSSKLDNLRNNYNPNDNFRKKILQKGAESYLSKKIPPAIAKRVVNSSVGQNILNNMSNNNNNKDLLDKLADRDDLWNDKSEDIDTKSDTDKKSDFEEQKKIIRGEINGEISKKLLKKILIITPFVAIIFLFIIITAAYINDDKNSSISFSEFLSGKDKKEIKELGKEIKNYSDEGKGKGTGTGKGSTTLPKDYYERLAYLGNLYSVDSECKDEDCYDRAEFKYYLKIADIAYRYREKYSIKLDWLLISATDLHFSKDTEKTMSDNLGGYSESSVENIDSTISLDWDYDYKNIRNYEYLDADNSTYDLQILAKNMVKKKTTQTCYDGSGNVTKTQDDEDIEDKYFEKNGSKRLKCGTGETYDISSNYEIDMDKYDEFMLEYIDKKMYSKGSGYKGNSSRTGDSNFAEAFVNLALEQLQDESRYGGQKYREYSWPGSTGYYHWCAAFVNWVVDHTEYNGQKLSDVIGNSNIDNPLAVVNWVNYFDKSEDIEFKYNDNCSKLSGKNGGSGNYVPKTGDIIFFNWSNSFYSLPATYESANHIGIVQRTENDTIVTIEGNSGNMVAERTYPINSCEVIGFGSWY